VAFGAEHRERSLYCGGGHPRAQAPFAVRWLLTCLIGVDEATVVHRSQSPASVGRRTRVTPARYSSRLCRPHTAT